MTGSPVTGSPVTGSPVTGSPVTRAPAYRSLRRGESLEAQPESRETSWRLGSATTNRRYTISIASASRNALAAMPSSASSSVGQRGGAGSVGTPGSEHQRAQPRLQRRHAVAGGHADHGVCLRRYLVAVAGLHGAAQGGQAAPAARSDTPPPCPRACRPAGCRAVRRGVRATAPECPWRRVASRTVASRSGRQRQASSAMASTSSGSTTGLPSKRFMPASRHCAWSSADTLAVRATIGMVAGRRRQGADFPRHLETAHAWHEDVHEHQVVGTAARPPPVPGLTVDGDIHQVALAAQQRGGDKLVGQDILHQQDTGTRQRCGGPAAPRRRARARAAGSAAIGSRTQNSLPPSASPEPAPRWLPGVIHGSQSMWPPITETSCRQIASPSPEPSGMTESASPSRRENGRNRRARPAGSITGPRSRTARCRMRPAAGVLLQAAPAGRRRRAGRISPRWTAG